MCMCAGLYILVSSNIMIEISKMYARRNILVSHDSGVLLDTYSQGKFESTN
jgi:hypothetical protein